MSATFRPACNIVIKDDPEITNLTAHWYSRTKIKTETCMWLRNDDWSSAWDDLILSRLSEFWQKVRGVRLEPTDLHGVYAAITIQTVNRELLASAFLVIKPAPDVAVVSKLETIKTIPDIAVSTNWTTRHCEKTTRVLFRAIEYAAKYLALNDEWVRSHLALDQHRSTFSLEIGQSLVSKSLDNPLYSPQSKEAMEALVLFSQPAAEKKRPRKILLVGEGMIRPRLSRKMKLKVERVKGPDGKWTFEVRVPHPEDPTRTLCTLKP